MRAFGAAAKVSVVRALVPASLAFAVLASGCDYFKVPKPVPEVQPSAAAASKPPVVPAKLDFIHDDYAAALAKARETGKPLFIDFWAPWCHTCRSMNANVFPDPALAPMGDRYVFLSVDTEKKENAAVVARYPINVWPTLLVVDPKEEKAALRWLGSASVPQLESLLHDGLLALKGGEEGHASVLARADRLYAEGDPAAASTLLKQLLEETPADWPRRGRAVETRLMTLALGPAAAPEACARFALEELKTLPRSSSWANAATWGLGCAIGVEDPEPTWRAEVVAPLEKRVEEALGEPVIAMEGDDRSGLYGAWYESRQAAKDPKGAERVGREWFDFLQKARAEAPSPDARAVYDGHLMWIGLELGKGEQVRDALLQSEAALPNDYNPPARLSIVLKSLGDLDGALAASDRAVSKVYGPRKVRVLNERGELLLARKDRDAARTAWTEALALIDTLPEAQRSKRERARAEKHLAETKP